MSSVSKIDQGPDIVQLMMLQKALEGGKESTAQLLDMLPEIAAVSPPLAPPMVSRGRVDGYT